METKSAPRVNKIRKYLEKSMQFVEIRYLPKFEKTWIYFGDKEIMLIEDPAKLDAGVAFRTDDGRIIEVQKRADPNEFVVKLNGKYLPNTKHDPKNKVSSLYFLYMGLFVLGIFGTIFGSLTLNLIIIFVMTFYLLSIVTAMVGIYFGNKYLFYYGFAIVIIDTLIVIVGTNFSARGAFVVVLWIVFRIYVIFESIRRMKHVHEYHNYRMSLKRFAYDGDVLDV